MDSQVFLTLLMAVSVFTGLFTEAVKGFYGEKPYSSNMIALFSSIVISILVSAFYIINFNVAFTIQTISHIVALIVLGALSSMCGYDKIVQALAQIKRY